MQAFSLLFNIYNHMSRGKYISPRDFRFFTSINNELMDDLIENVVLIYKISVESTKTNIYGEVSQKSGKVYYNPVEMTSLVDRSAITSSDEGFGVDKNQVYIFKFLEQEARRLNFFPEVGDLVMYNGKYFEIGNSDREQLLGGQEDKSWSIICNTHYVALSNLQIVPRIK